MATQLSTIIPEQLHAAQLRGDQPALLDVRTAAEYRAGHIPGARLLPVGELRPDEVTRRFKQAAPGHQEPLYITCRSGARAREAAERLQLAGSTNLALVEGGTQGWEQSGLPVRRCSNAIPLERQIQIAGDTLLIRGTRRTDFQNGDPAAQYDSLFGKPLKLPEDTCVYPVHDYNGMTVSTIGEEKRHNPRLQVSGKQGYIDQMNALELDDPRLMDIAVPDNRACRVIVAA